MPAKGKAKAEGKAPAKVVETTSATTATPEVKSTTPPAQVPTPAQPVSEKQVEADKPQSAAQKLHAAVERHQRIVNQRERGHGPGADPLFEPLRRFFPEFEIHKVPVPSKAMSQSVHDAEVEMLNLYSRAGFIFLADDMVSPDGRGDTCPLAHYDVIDGRVVISNYYAMIASKTQLRRVREGNIEYGAHQRHKMLSEEAGDMYNLPKGARVESKTADEKFDLMFPKER